MIYFFSRSGVDGLSGQKNKIHADQVRPLLGNQLVMISPKYLHIPFKPQPDFKIAKVFNGYLCTAQMETVPAGKYAKQALTRLRWLNDLKGRIVGTDDVRSTLTFVEQENVNWESCTRQML